MRWVFAKELRENARWAALIGAVTIVWTYVRLAVGEMNALVQVGEVLALVAPLAGLVMGIAQSAFETRPDNWAFVVHRPIDRRRLFIAKCLSGLGLLYAGLVLPIILAAAWAARPGHAPMPFNPELMLPPLADALAAAAWYFTGVILTLRRARWYGSRSLPAGLALVTSAWVYFVPDLWLALFGCAISIPLLAAAAWGAFSGGGAISDTFLPKLGLGSSIVAGSLLLFLLASAIASEFDSVIVRTHHNVEPDGTIVVSRLVQDRSGISFSVTDLDGKPLERYAGLGHDSPELHARWLQYWSALADDRFIGWPVSREVTGYRSAIPLRVSVDGGYPRDVRPTARSWFNAKRRAIELYDLRTRLLVGTVGTDGFAPVDQPPRGAFPPGPPLNVRGQRRNHTLAFPSAVYWLELDRRRARPIFTASPDDPVVAAGDFDPPGAQRPLATILTRHRLHIIDPSGQERMHFSAPLEFDRDRYSGVSVSVLPGELNVVVTAWPERDGERVYPVFEFGRDGTPVRRLELAALPPDRAISRNFSTLAGLGTPLAAVPAYRPWNLERHFHIRRRAGENWGLYLRCMIVSACLSAAAAGALAWWHYGLATPQTLVWMTLAAVLGPAGVVALLSLHDAPVRERCPGCGKMRRVDEAVCRRCRSPHAPPAADGREIFEPADPSPAPGLPAGV